MFKAYDWVWIVCCCVTMLAVAHHTRLTSTSKSFQSSINSKQFQLSSTCFLIVTQRRVADPTMHQNWNHKCKRLEAQPKSFLKKYHRKVCKIYSVEFSRSFNVKFYWFHFDNITWVTTVFSFAKIRPISAILYSLW